MRIFVCGETEKGEGGGLCLLFVYLIYTIVNINAEVGLPGAHRKGGETEQTGKKKLKRKRELKKQNLIQDILECPVMRHTIHKLLREGVGGVHQILHRCRACAMRASNN